MTAAPEKPARPLSGYTLWHLRQHCLQWYVRPICYAALGAEPEANSIVWAVAKFVEDRDEGPIARLEHRFILSPDPQPRWPHAVCAGQNALYGARSEQAVRAAHELLYGAPSIDIGERDGALLAWEAFAKLDRRPSDRDATAFSPVFALWKREALPTDYVRGPFASSEAFVATLYDPDTLHGSLFARHTPTTPRANSRFGPEELARLRAAWRRSNFTVPWSEHLRRELPQLLALADRLVAGELSTGDRALLGSSQLDQLLRSAERVLDDT